MAETTIAELTLADGRLTLGWRDGGRAVLHPLWLRERLPDAAVLDPRTGQRLIEAAELPLDLGFATAEIAEGDLRIVFSDGMAARLGHRWLRDQAMPAAVPAIPDGAVPWDAGLDPLPQAAFTEVARDDAALADMLQALHVFGFVVVHGVPGGLDGALELTGRIGPIRITNWGGLADVRAIPDAYDLTMTPRGLEPHADNPYRLPVPGYIFLHCLTNDAEGGESTVVDGFGAAMALKARDPDGFRILTEVRPRFSYVDDDAILESSGPLIECDPAGTVRQVRYSNRTEMVPPLDPALLDRYYRARRDFYALLTDPGLVATFKLQPGDLMIMDNYRLLHGRRPFRLETGSRHMRQCYMDRDIVDSRRLILRRRFAA